MNIQCALEATECTLLYILVNLFTALVKHAYYEYYGCLASVLREVPWFWILLGKKHSEISSMLKNSNGEN